MRSRIDNRRTLPVAGLILAIAGLFTVSSALATAQGDCVVPHGISVPQIRGQVFDAFGIAVPFATVTVLGIHGAVQTTADNAGEFSFAVGPGHYVLKAESEGFSYSSAEVKVGRSLQAIFGRQRLKVMLGFGDTYCPWVTTSNQKFRESAEANLNRLKQSAQIYETSPDNETAQPTQAGQSNDTSQTKETSHTNAAQK